MHYMRWYKNGSPNVTRSKPNGYWKNEFERLAVIETDDCVEWDGPSDLNGHGRVFYDYKNHRVGALALENRNITANEKTDFVLHRPLVCHNPKCMNYRHLYWGTHKDNMNDKLQDGTSMKGSLHPRAKLDENKARLIRNSKDSDLQLSKIYGVDRKVIWSIRKGLVWKDV